MGCDCSTSDKGKEEEEWWASDDHGILIAISGPPCSGRSALSTLLLNNLDNGFLLRQEDYARGSRPDGGQPHVRCDNTKVDNAKLKKDVLVAAQHYSFVIMEGRWAFQDPALVNLMHFKVHLNISEEECFIRLVGKDGAAEKSIDSISEELFYKWFKPYFQDAKGYINNKVVKLTEKPVNGEVMIFEADEGDGIHGAAEAVLASILETRAPAVAKTNDLSASTCAAAAAGDEKWTTSGHGRSAAASSSSEVSAN